jgi:hypothetical protein
MSFPNQKHGMAREEVSKLDISSLHSTIMHKRRETHLNTFNQPTNAWIINQTSWIQSVLNLMEGDARTWALPHLEELQHGRDPFGGIWQTFVDQFSRRFAPLDTAESAREALKKIRQGKGSVPEYMAQFDQHTGQTGWSDADHRQRFYDGLSEFVKDGLALTDRPIGTFDEVTGCSAGYRPAL